MEAHIVFNANTSLFDLIIEINGIKETISTSKNYGHWQYHLNRGTLSKSVAKYGISTFVYIGFAASDPPQTPVIETPPINVAPSLGWFSLQLLDHKVKKRGRPRKHTPSVAGVTVYKVSDDEPEPIPISKHQREAIERNFKQFQKTMSTREALQEITDKFNITYKAAYDVIAAYI